MSNPYEEKLRQFADDEVLFHAVKGILMSHCDLNSVHEHSKTNFGTEDTETLGHVTRGFGLAKHVLARGFKELEKYRTPAAPSRDAKNPNQV